MDASALSSPNSVASRFGRAPRTAPVQEAAPQQTASQTASQPGEAQKEKGGFGFWDLVDIINPLQHLPVIGPIYREITGDEIGAPAKLAGGGLFGGVIGLAASAADVLIKEATGKDTGQHIIAMLGFGNDETVPVPDAAVIIAVPETGNDGFTIARLEHSAVQVAEAPEAMPAPRADLTAAHVETTAPPAPILLASHFAKPPPSILPKGAENLIGDPALLAQSLRDGALDSGKKDNGEDDDAETVETTGASGPPPLPPQFVADMLAALDRYEQRAN